MIFFLALISIANLTNSQYTSFSGSKVVNLPDEGVMIDSDPKNVFFHYLKFEPSIYSSYANLATSSSFKELTDLTYNFSSSDDNRTLARLNVRYIIPAFKNNWTNFTNRPNVVNGFQLFLDEVVIGYANINYTTNANEMREEWDDIILEGTVYNVPSSIYKISVRAITNSFTVQWGREALASTVMYMSGEYMAEGIKENDKFVMPFVDKAPFFVNIKASNRQAIDFKWSQTRKHGHIGLENKDITAKAIHHGHKSVYGMVELRDHIYTWTQTYGTTKGENMNCYWIWGGVVSVREITPDMYHSFYYGWNYGVSYSRMTPIKAIPQCYDGLKIDVELNFGQDYMIFRGPDGTSYMNTVSFRGYQPLVHGVELYYQNNSMTITNLQKFNIN
jgi:hypothetical protein